MKGAELARLIRDDEILRLRDEEKLTHRQIAQRVGISHVMVGRILTKRISATEENIRERREHLAEMLEQLMIEMYKKAKETRLPSDVNAFAKLVDSYKSMFGLNAPSSVSVEVSDHSAFWANHFNERRTVDGTVVE